MKPLDPLIALAFRDKTFSSELVAHRVIKEKISSLSFDYPKEPAPKSEKPSKKKLWGPRLGVTGYASAKPVLDTPTQVMISPLQGIEQGLPVHVDHLIDRWSGDKALKARLCQLGGRKGDLFKGSITHAQTVEAVTKDMDYEGLPWFPTSQDRDFWIQTDSSTFVKLILNKQ